MNARRIRILRLKFILVSMFSFMITMLVISTGINVANYRTSVSLVRRALEHIIENDGELPRHGLGSDFQIGSIADVFSPRYKQYQYYSCVYDENHSVICVMNHLVGQGEEEQLQEMADVVSDSIVTFGRYGNYFFQIGENSEGNVLVVFIDGTMELSTAARLFYWTLLILGVGMVVTLILVGIFSKRMIQPEIESSLRQKQFITNASHELKTPLSVIRANVELMEIMGGETELSQSTLKQVDRMNGLIQNLVMIAKSEEKEDQSELLEVDVSALVEESVKSFQAAATQEKLGLETHIEENLKRKMDGSQIRTLATILVDNAIKYCDKDGKITVRLSSIRRGKGFLLTVSNTYADGKGLDCSRFFDRFYRQDSSHNIDKGGYGIGLSIAEGVCRKNGGTLKAEWKDGEISFICRFI